LLLGWPSCWFILLIRCSFECLIILSIHSRCRIGAMNFLDERVMQRTTVVHWAQGRPVLVSKYQNASKLWFYTKMKKRCRLTLQADISILWMVRTNAKGILDSTVLIYHRIGWLLEPTWEIDRKRVEWHPNCMWWMDIENYTEVVLDIERRLSVIKTWEKLSGK